MLITLSYAFLFMFTTLIARSAYLDDLERTKANKEKAGQKRKNGFFSRLRLKNIFGPTI